MELSGYRDDLRGRVAIVTGAARGLGLHFADALVAEGMKVALVARSADLLEKHAQRLGENALAVPADIASPDSVREVFARTVERFGRLDVLVNSATMNRLHRIEDITDAELASEVGVNIMGVIYCIREAIPLMRKAGGGDIINVSSESVTRPFPLLSLYAATKAGIENLTVGLREELRHDKIRVTTFRSGTVDSGGMFLSDAPPDRFQKFFDDSNAFGFMHDTGLAIAPQIAADALIALLRAPHQAHIDFISVRAR